MLPEDLVGSTLLLSWDFVNDLNNCHAGSAEAAGLPSSTTPASSSSGISGVRSETEEILDSILPPREWDEEGQLWRQSVSSTPATRLDVINLQEQLDQKLQQRQARETGICQVFLDGIFHFLRKCGVNKKNICILGSQGVVCTVF